MAAVVVALKVKLLKAVKVNKVQSALSGPATHAHSHQLVLETYELLYRNRKRRN